MKGSKIEWCDHTFNSWIGCTKVSPGCTNCYAEALNARMQWCVWGAAGKRQRTSAAYWMQPLAWGRASALSMVCWRERQNGPAVLRYKEPQRPRVFCGSLCDWLDDAVPIEWLADLLDLIRRTPALDWLLLTKRPENWLTRVSEASRCMSVQGSGYAHLRNWVEGVLPANIWIGATVEDQQRADARIPALLSIPARVRFLSCEPLLGPVQLGLTHPTDSEWPEAHADLRPYHDVNCDEFWRRGIDWVICGGESGPKARPMHPDWARSLRDQCEVAGVPFLFKQWGEWGPSDLADATRWIWNSGLVLPVHQVNASSAVREGAVPILRVGKHVAGRLLDGVLHDGFPEVRA